MTSFCHPLNTFCLGMALGGACVGLLLRSPQWWATAVAAVNLAATVTLLLWGCVQHSKRSKEMDQLMRQEMDRIRNPNRAFVQFMESLDPEQRG